MVKIWPCFEGDVVTAGEPWKEITLKQCVEMLDLRPCNYLCPLGQTRDFGKRGDNLGTFGGYQHVIAEVSAVEAAAFSRDWKPGIYCVPMTPADVHETLGLASGRGLAEVWKWRDGDAPDRRLSTTTMPPRETQPNERLKPDKVAYWYFRLNGFLQIENFVVHPRSRGGQRTDADLLAVRFPYRREFLFDHEQPMQDDAQTLDLSFDCIDIVIVEIKANQPCSLNGPWTKKGAQNIHRVLAAIGCFQEDEIGVAASSIYEKGAFRNDRVRVRLVAVGRNICARLADQYDEIIQLTWEQMLCFVWKRFDTYTRQKRDVEQWDKTGKKLRSMAMRAREARSFVKQALPAMSITDRE